MRSGVFALSAKLIGFVGGAVLAFLSYHTLAHYLAPHISARPGVLEAASFAVAFFILEWILRLILRKIFSLLPESFHTSLISRILAIIPGIIDGLILIALALFLLVVAPYFTSAKAPIEDSVFGSALVGSASHLEVYIDEIFGQATESTLGFLTVEPEDGQSVALPYQATDLIVDPAAETQMLALVNAVRAKAGVGPLVMDATLQKAARAHSTDMWQRQYFAHIDPDGHDPFDRMRAVGATFTTAGENLALARNTERAHEGLMNSPGHKRNILDPDFTKVGIGIVDGGIYGMMFTQDFSN
jgi:uncharacterized protein YkwD